MTASRRLVIGSRGSPLALWQARWVEARLRALGRDTRLEIIRTSGDRFADQSLVVLGGQGLFVKEIEEALLARGIDLAVHSLKDLPTVQPPGLAIACVPERAAAADALVARGRATLRALPTGSVVGTGSPRRASQIRHLRPDLAIRAIRGNVDTRVERLRRGECDALILAAAGLVRLGIEVEATPLGPEEMLPAVGQGALAIETRADDRDLVEALAPLQHAPTAAAVRAERALLRGLGGGCQAPIAAHATVAGDLLTLVGLVAALDGRRVVRGGRSGRVAEAETIGARLAEDLLGGGARDLLPRLDPGGPA